MPFELCYPWEELPWIDERLIVEEALFISPQLWRVIKVPLTEIVAPFCFENLVAS